jgi:hypothetical protein
VLLLYIAGEFRGGVCFGFSLALVMVKGKGKREKEKAIS